MSKNKILLGLLVSLSVSVCSVSANVTVSDLILPKAPAYRVGISDIPENQYIEAEQDKENARQISEKKLTQDASIDNSYADLSIKRLSKEISQSLEFEEQDMVSDLSLLWQGAAMQSDTINFALYKLANPDADKPNKQTVKNVLKSIASMSTLVGASMANPLLAGTSLVTGNVLGIMSQDTKALNYKYTKVTDADMIILIRKVEDLQQNAVNLYYDYMMTKKQLDMITNLLQERRKRFETAQKNNVTREMLVITDAYYRTALDKQKTARSEFLSKRAALEQFVGNEVFNQFENELAKREHENSEKSADASYSRDYQQTIQNVENYNNSLKQSEIPHLRQSENFNPYDYDKNLDKLPEVQPIGQVSEPVDKVQTENESVTQEVQQPEKKVRKTRAQKEAEKYSTKGLIFLHSEKKETQDLQTQPANPVKEQKVKKSKKEKKQKDSNPVQNINNQTSSQTVQKQKKETFNGVELLPLEEIKVPDLHKNGYSIFAP